MPSLKLRAMRIPPAVALLAPTFLLLCGCHFGNRDQPPAPVAKPGKTMDDYNRPLAPGESALMPVDIATMPDIPLRPEDRAGLLAAIEHSLTWLGLPVSSHKYPVSGISKDQVVRSLQALSQLARDAHDEQEFNREIKRRFRALMSVGCDRRGTVLFTGYYTPIFDASLTATAEFRYPVYKRPDDLLSATSQDQPSLQQQPGGVTRPYPTRNELETSHALNGHELVYFRDPYEAYVVEVQGSAKVRLNGGQMMDIGFNGTNGQPYHPIAQDLVTEGKIKAADLSLATVRAYFHAHPAELPGYTARNPRVIFFSRTSGGPFGSLGQAVTRDITVATDKSIFPPGAPCLAATAIATQPGDRGSATAGLRLDQDTGGAIRAPGRCDLYMGEGDAAERRAGSQFAEGRLYYLILRE
jgi:membrane-bound lytic murein transglycosylase A